MRRPFFIAAGRCLAVCLLAALPITSSADDVQRARHFWQAGELKPAVILLKGHLQQHPDDAEARLLLAQTYIDLMLGAAAEGELAKAQSAGATPAQVIEPLVRAQLLQNEPERALDALAVADGGNPGGEAMLLALRGESERRLGDRAAAADAFARALALDPNQTDALLGQARLALASGRLDDARTFAVRATAVEATSAPAWELLAEIDFAVGDFAAAERSLIKAEVAAHNKMLPRFKRALTRIELGRLDEAAADIDAVADAYPDFVGLHFARGVLLLHQGRLGEGIQSLNTFLKYDPNNTRALYMIGIAEGQRGNIEVAEGLLMRFNEAQPASAQGASALARLFLKRNDHRAAIALLTPFADRDDVPPDVLVVLSEAMERQGRFADARGLLDRAVAAAPDRGEYLVASAANLAKLGRRDEALADLAKAIGIDPLNRNAQLLRIKLLLEAQDFERALEFAEALAKTRSDDPYALNALGLARIGAGQEADARAAFERALAASPGFADAALNLGRLLIRDGDSEGARRMFAEVLAVDPRHVEAILALGELDAARGDRNGQVQRLEAAVDAAPNTPELRAALARVLLAGGEPARVLTLLQGTPEALQQEPRLLLLRGEAELAMGAPEDAIVTYQTLREVMPSDAAGHYLLARAYAAAGQDGPMRESLVRAVELEPGHPLGPATQELVLKTIDDRVLQLDYMDRLLRASDEDPRIVARKADLLVALGDTAQAEGLMLGLQERYPDDAGVFYKLLDVQRAGGDRDSYTKTLEEWVARRPDDLAAKLLLAQFLFEQGDDARSLELLRSMAKEQPDNPTVLNNLAWLLRESDPEQARNYAEQAVRLRPRSAAFLDTLGVLLLDQEAPQARARALELIEDARAIDPADAGISFHYTQALVRNDRADEARLILLELVQRDFPEREAARRLLAEVSD